MICTLSRHAAQAKGHDDALMFDWRGQVAEATGANAFFVRNGSLHTPTPDCFLDGITRRTVIDLARRRGVEVVERAIWPEELEGFEQFFLTGSAAEVTPVASAGPVEFRGRRADPAAAQGLSRPRQPPAVQRLTQAVTPAKAGVSAGPAEPSYPEVPAFAGMTGGALGFAGSNQRSDLPRGQAALPVDGGRCRR